MTCESSVGVVQEDETTTMMQKSTRKGAKRSTKPEITRMERAVNREVNVLKSLNIHFIRRITSSGTVSTNGSGFIPITTIASSGSVSGLSDFSNVSGLYLEYRVRGMKATLMPINAVNISGVAAPPAMLVTAFFSSGVAAVTFQQALDSSGAKFHSGYRTIVAEVDFKGNKDAQLWTPTTAAVTSAETYGIFITDSGVAPASSVTTTMYRLVAEYIVEFRSAA